MLMEDILRIGVITSPHGVKGEVKVYPTTDDARRFSSLKSVLLKTPEGIKRINVRSVRYHKNMVIIGLEGYESMNDAEKLRDCTLHVTRDEAVKLDKDEYFVADLIDMTVHTDIGTDGRLTDVMQTGANDVYVIKLDDGRELLLPAIADCILGVDTDSAVMTVHVLPGLLD